MLNLLLTEGFAASIQAASHLDPPIGRTDCWSIPCDDAPGAADGLLAPEERAQADRFHFARDRNLYVASHAALRLILSGYLGLSAKELQFDRESGGRPVLYAPCRPLHFNISHSGTKALIAVSCTAEVGVDIEQVRGFADYEALARQHFAPDEQDGLILLPEERRLAAFFVTWTRKEAFLKALGTGLSHPLDAFSTGRQSSAPELARPPGMPVPGWTLADLPVGDGYKGAIAVAQAPVFPIRHQEAAWA